MIDSDIIIDIKNVSFSYGRDNALQNVDITIPRLQSGCIVGPNGGGKSTLLKLILGLLVPQSGTIRVFGKNPAKARLGIGYMPQYHQLDAALPVTVREVVQMGQLGAGNPARVRREIVHDAMAELGICHLAEKNFSSLSGGQQQRVLISRAIACQPELLLLDEPTANIDPGAEEQFYGTLDELRRRMTVLTVSHDLGFVDRETDLVICVNKNVSIHRAEDFTAASADEVYNHSVNFIKHDHKCFCGCGHHREAK